jgi:hypothetical protein
MVAWQDLIAEPPWDAEGVLGISDDRVFVAEKDLDLFGFEVLVHLGKVFNLESYG